MKTTHSLLTAAAAATSLALLNRYLVRTDATPAETRRPLPGDGSVPQPYFHSTHAVTVDATPGQLWPWLAQKGLLPLTMTTLRAIRDRAQDQDRARRPDLAVPSVSDTKVLALS